jgi:DNA-binding transcriptional LysR family regulator
MRFCLVRLTSRGGGVSLTGATPSSPRRCRVAFADLKGQPLVTLAAGTGLRMGLEEACAEAGFAPRIVAETTEIRSLLDLSAANVGVALVPRSVGGDDRLVLVDICKPRIERPIGLAWNDATASPAVRAFITLAHEYFDDEPASVTPMRRTG